LDLRRSRPSPGFVDKELSEAAQLLLVHLSAEGLGRENASYQAKGAARRCGRGATSGMSSCMEGSSESALACLRCQARAVSDRNDPDQRELWLARLRILLRCSLSAIGGRQLVRERQQGAAEDPGASKPFARDQEISWSPDGVGEDPIHVEDAAR
jgi:hypothetical protein